MRRRKLLLFAFTAVLASATMTSETKSCGHTRVKDADAKDDTSVVSTSNISNEIRQEYIIQQ